MKLPTKQLLVTSENLCLNPGFETILPGSHTSAITTLSTTGYQNIQFPAWQLQNTVIIDETITVIEETANVSSGSKRSAQVDLSGTVPSYPRLIQIWNSSEYLEERAISCREKYLTVALDVKMDSPVSNACRAFLYHDGTGSNTFTSGYKANDSSYERLLVPSRLIPDDCTEISFGAQFESLSPTFYVDNVMVVLSDSPLAELPYMSRNAIKIVVLDTTTGVVVDDDGTNKASFHDANFNWSTSGAWDLPNDKPAWANYIDMKLYCNNYSGSATYVYCAAAPKGVSNQDYRIQGYINTTQSFIGEIICPIGQDALMQFAYRENRIQITPQRWIGEGL